MRHEKENRELVSKLVLLKNQILENDIATASENLTFGAVKIVHSGGFIKAQPVPVSLKIKKDKNDDYFLVIESRQYKAEINFESLEEVEETEDERLSISYIAPHDT